MLFAKTSVYAQELSEDLEDLAWPQAAKNMQSSWIAWDPDTQTARLHDWCISRQRSWGTPVPLIICDTCGEHPIPESALPVLNLPTQPALADRAMTCPNCGQTAYRSSETLDTFWDSAFYFLIYPQVEQGILPSFVPGSLLINPHHPCHPVDMYIGGLEHATMHLLYARWFMRVLKCIGEPVAKEPFSRLIGQGMVCAPAYQTTPTASRPSSWVRPEDISSDDQGGWFVTQTRQPVTCVGSVKMSKSKKNGVDPTQAIEIWGVDAVRLALMFAGPYDQDMSWTPSLIQTCHKHIGRIKKISQTLSVHPYVPSQEPKDVAFQEKIIRAYEEGQGIHAMIGYALGVLRDIEKKHIEKPMWAISMFHQVCDALYPVAPQTIQEFGSALGWHPRAVHALSQDQPKTMTLQIDGKARGSIPEVSSPEEAWMMIQRTHQDVIHRWLPQGPRDWLWIKGRVFNLLSDKKSS